VAAHRPRLDQDLFHVRYESIPATRHGLDENWVVRVVAQRPSEPLKGGGQVGLFHKRIGPEPMHQGVFLNDPPALLDEDEEHVEDLGGERHGLVVSHEHSLVGVDREVSEPIQVAHQR
jgi:hypothetical protein